jgi:hypothetical protein
VIEDEVSGLRGDSSYFQFSRVRKIRVEGEDFNFVPVKGGLFSPTVTRLSW